MYYKQEWKINLFCQRSDGLPYYKMFFHTFTFCVAKGCINNAYETRHQRTYFNQFKLLQTSEFTLQLNGIIHVVSRHPLPLSVSPQAYSDYWQNSSLYRADSSVFVSETVWDHSNPHQRPFEGRRSATQAPRKFGVKNNLNL